MRYGIFKITFCTKGDAKSFERIHWGTASGARVGIVRDEVAATGTANLMGHVIRGMKGDKGIDVAQANETVLKAEMDGMTG